MQWKGLVFGVLLCLAAGVPHPSSGEGRLDPPLSLSGRAVRVPDGDTLHLMTEHGVERVRISGIDAPELGQPYSRVARTALSNLVNERVLSLACDKRDIYGRLVCAVRVEGTDVGLQLVLLGLAWHFKRYEDEQSPSDRVAYSTAEEEARRQRIGLFRQDQPMPPWDCRQRKREGGACEHPSEQ